MEWGVVVTEFSTVRIIPPSNVGGSRATAARAGSGEVRDLVVANAGDSEAFVRRPLFAHAGNTHSGSTAAGARPMVAAPFLAQHLDQEWIHRDSAAEPRFAAQAYTRAALAPAPRHDLAPPA